MRTLITAIILLAPLATAAVNEVFADTVELSGGGHVSGEVRRVGDTKVPYVVVEVDSAIRVALPESRVRRVVTDAELAEYRRLAKIAGNDAESNYRLARWCSANSLPGQNRYHMQRAIEIDPDHALARAALTYQKDQNEWVLYSELQRNRGMIKVGVRWQLPEAVAIQKAQDEAEVGAKKWIREIARLRTVALRGGDAGAEAIATLTAIEDPLAAPAIASELLESRNSKSAQPRALRQLWVKLLGRFRNTPAVEGLVRAGVEEIDDVVREAALEQLQSYGAGSAVATYVPMLKSNNNREVNRAARALSFFPDPELAFTLVDALVTEHKSVTPASGATQAGFGSDGSISSSMGSKAIVRKDYVNNPAVLTLLKMIEPEVDFGFNEARWRDYFANKWVAYSGDLRRDP